MHSKNAGQKRTAKTHSKNTGQKHTAKTHSKILVVNRALERVF
jgi:hypothetical protein